MANYLLKCQVCGWEFEDSHSIKEEHPPCPRCGGRTEAVIASNVAFKGLPTSKFHLRSIKKEK